MKKKIIGGLIVIFALFALLYLWSPSLVVDIITDYKPFTHEHVLNSADLREVYGIGDKSTPEDYGFNAAEEFTIRSLNDSLNLSSWYVPSSESSKCIVLIHGRTSNRLKPMKYLELFKNTGIDTLYNVLIPDLRNSGKSDPAKTYMGYKFAEDLLAYLLYLKSEKQQDTILIYGFSMGAMAAMTMMNRPELIKILDTSGIYFEKVIFDSPLSNVKMTLKKNADAMHVPDFLFAKTFDIFDANTNGYATNMSLSRMIGAFTAPALIIQGKEDKTTPYYILQHELELLNPKIVDVYYFEKGEHVRAYQTEEYKQEYTKIIGDFIRSK